MEADEERLVELTQQISLLYHNNIGINKVVELMRDQNVSVEVVASIYYQLFDNTEKLMRERFHYYVIECDMINDLNIVDCWTSRYFLTYSPYLSNSALHEITIFDVFNDRSIKVTVEKSARRLNKIYPLNDGFGLLTEVGHGSCFISLIFMDICRRDLRKLHTIKYNFHMSKIVVNKADSTTFLLDDEESWKICQIVEEKIMIGHVVEIGFHPDCFYGNCIYKLSWSDGNIQARNMPRVYIYNVEENTRNQFDLEMPTGYDIDWGAFGSFVRGNLLIELKCENNSRVIGRLNVQTRQWNVLDFSSKSTIRSIDWFEEGSLIVRTQKNNLKKHNFCKIPFGKPESLENTAWLSLVKAMKKRDTVENPYEAARKYLPPNSDINCLFD